MESMEAILSYWFSDLDDGAKLETASAMFRLWFGKDEETDQEIRERFEEDVLWAAEGRHKDWERMPLGRLALVILLDQFPRNMYRGTPRAFETDPLALSICLQAQQERADRALFLIQRMFLYMPMMHAESRAIQEKSVHAFGMLVEQAKELSPMNVDFFSYSYDYALKHRAIIQRFGRFPHRNEILSRTSTPEEAEFLKGPDSSF